jgi:hypothetical protein
MAGFWATLHHRFLFSLAMKSTATLKLPLTDYLEALAKSELL